MSASSRSVWLRRGNSSDPDFYAPGKYSAFELAAIGNAAARETFVTGTSHMAAIWTDLFQSIITPRPELRWFGDGPGVGRDARIAYSSLLGRYMARAYLTEREGVRILVPLDEAKRWLEGTPYVIEKDPPGKVHEADWIGLDNKGLVIVEAKGRFHDGARGASRMWSGPYGRPPVLKTAIGQAERTAVFVRRTRRKLLAKRWAIVSRWATDRNRWQPTLLAWDSKEERLPQEDHRELSRILRRADLESVLMGLGHRQAVEALNAMEPPSRIAGELQIRSGNRELEPGLVAAIGPFGVRLLRNGDDIVRLERVRELNPNVALASLSSRYVRAVSQDADWSGEEEVEARPTSERYASRAGLAVMWLVAGEEVVLVAS